ncbi:hypothetical protein [Parabacteroides chongii]|uniref:hypothetical protein n=1 Tax=Parabacteroides chongii TaxID=2685834 RepID=UPI00240D02F7|nr:hypothetical protein [Parabacteroides chongii]WFE85953.1 hypothetical protein P3L47_04955 [Parabacteroides chongii]
MKTVKEFQAEVKREESVLNQLVKRGAASSVIEAQKEAVKIANSKLEAALNTPTEKAIQSTATAGFVTFNVVKDGETTKESKKIAFVKHNRPVDTKRVDKYIYIIAQNKYEEAYPIIVAEAEKVLEKEYAVVDVNGNTIDKTTATDYYVILDGQHRGTAFAKLAAAGEEIEIPNVYIRNKENIGEYLVDINEAAKSWDNKDKFAVAGLTAKDEALITISEKIGEGFNPSTTALIYLGKKLSSKLLNQVLKGEDVEFPKGAKFNKDRGNKFITLCKAAGMEVNLITKRYYIDGFNSYAASTNEDTAFGALKEIGKLNDFQKRIKAVKDGNDFIQLLKEVA